MKRLLPIASLCIAACTTQSPSSGEVTDALEQSDVTRAHDLLDSRITAGVATPSEHALSAFTFLMNITDTCPASATAAADLGIVLDTPRDIFGATGFLQRHSQLGAENATNWLVSRVDTGSNGVLESGGNVSDLLETAELMLPCLDEMSSRLEQAFTRAGSSGSVEVVLPKGVLYADDDLMLEGPELRSVQASLMLSAAGVRLARAFDWDFPNDIQETEWLYQPSPNQLSAARADFEARAQMLDAKFLTLMPGGAAALSVARDELQQSLEVALDAAARARNSDTDSRGAIRFSALQPAARDEVEAHAGSLRDALSGDAVVPQSSNGLTWNLSTFFNATFEKPMYRPYEVEEFSFGDWASFELSPVEAYWAGFVNQFFSARVVEDPGLLGGPAEADIFLYPFQVENAFENSVGLWLPLEDYLDRNWNGLFCHLFRDGYYCD